MRTGSALMLSAATALITMSSGVDAGVHRSVAEGCRQRSAAVDAY